MKRALFFIVCAVIVVAGFISCLKSSSSTTSCINTPVEKDSVYLLQFASDSMTLTKDTTGLYYQILDSGAGVSPAPTSHLVVTYTGMLMDRTVFDSETNGTLNGLQLNQLIAGWQIGLPKIKKGGHIRLLIPSALAYGCTGLSTAIPPNNPVYFDVQLIDVN